jgi:hypothetical protein
VLGDHRKVLPDLVLGDRPGRAGVEELHRIAGGSCTGGGSRVVPAGVHRDLVTGEGEPLSQGGDVDVLPTGVRIAE